MFHSIITFIVKFIVTIVAYFLPSMTFSYFMGKIYDEKYYLNKREEKNEGFQAFLGIIVIFIDFAWLKYNPDMFTNNFFENNDWGTILGTILGILMLISSIIVGINDAYGAHKVKNEKKQEINLEHKYSFQFASIKILTWLKKYQYILLVALLITLLLFILDTYLLSILSFKNEKPIINYDIGTWFIIQMIVFGFIIYFFILYILAIVYNISDDISREQNKFFIYYLFSFPKLKPIGFPLKTFEDLIKDIYTLFVLCVSSFLCLFLCIFLLASFFDIEATKIPIFKEPRFEYIIINDYKKLQNELKNLEEDYCENIGDCGVFNDSVIAINDYNLSQDLLLCNGCNGLYYRKKVIEYIDRGLYTKSYVLGVNYRYKILVQMLSNKILNENNNIDQIDKIFLSWIKYMKEVFYMVLISYPTSIKLNSYAFLIFILLKTFFLFGFIDHKKMKLKL